MERHISPDQNIDHIEDVHSKTTNSQEMKQRKKGKQGKTF